MAEPIEMVFRMWTEWTQGSMYWMGCRYTHMKGQFWWGGPGHDQTCPV